MPESKPKSSKPAKSTGRVQQPATSANKSLNLNQLARLAANPSTADLTPGAIMQLQRMVGNKATRDLIQRVGLKSIREEHIRETIAKKKNKPKMNRVGKAEEDVGAYTARMVTELNKLLRDESKLDVWGEEKLYAKARPIIEEVYYPPDRGGASATLSWNGSEMGEGSVVNKIKDYLPENGHGDVSGAMNDVILGRGKATTGHDDVLHASAGKSGSKGGCTLFFTRDGDDVDIVGVGQHKTSSSYTIYYGESTFGTTLNL